MNDNTLGQVPTMVGYPWQVFGPNYKTGVVTGTATGVPGVDGLDQGAQAPGAVGQTAGVFGQPVFWLVVMMAVGVILLSHAAHLSVKG